MKRLLIAAVAAAALAAPALAGLKTGEKAPAFTVQASLAGKTLNFSLAAALKKGPVVVYFYPAAYTGGCNVQAREFAVNQPKFAAAGASIIGVSTDTIDRLNEYSADPEFCAGKFPVASDADGRVARAFGLKVNSIAAVQGYKDSRGRPIGDRLTIERVTYVIGRDGKVAAAFSSNDDKIKPAEHISKSLALVQALKR